MNKMLAIVFGDEKVTPRQPSRRGSPAFALTISADNMSKSRDESI